MVGDQALSWLRVDVQSPECRGANTHVVVAAQSYMNTVSSFFSVACSPNRAKSAETLARDLFAHNPFHYRSFSSDFSPSSNTQDSLPIFIPKRCILIARLFHVPEENRVCVMKCCFVKLNTHKPFLVLILGSCSLQSFS